MTLHTDKYEVLTKREVHGHRKGEVFELTAEKGLIGVLVKSGLIRAHHDPEGEK